MTPEPGSTPSFEVAIAGGGVAALEAALALRDLAGERLGMKLIAPNSEFVYRPMTVVEPFSFGTARRYPLHEVASDLDLELIEDAAARVDPDARVLHTTSGASFGFDALVLGLGARPLIRYEHAVTIDDRRLDEQLHGLVRDVEDGYVKRLAFIIPPRMAWPLAIYELALMTSTRAYEMNVEVEITILTPEDAPLAVFGQHASRAVGELLADNAVTVLCSSYCEVPQSGLIEISPGDRRLEVDRVVALPELEGPALDGLPEAPDGFIPIDLHCQVRDTARVYAAGDATDFPIKQGGIASQMADTAAQAIAALAGAPVQLQPFDPTIHGILLTGGKPRYLNGFLTGGRGFSCELTDEPTFSPPTKISAKYLSPYLLERDRSGRPSQSP
jgi:sulfide:quinone oxidoreductase